MMGVKVSKYVWNGLSVIALVVVATGYDGAAAQANGKRSLAQAERRALARPSPVQLAQVAQTYHVSIPAQPLLSALADFTAATGVRVLRLDDEPISGTSRPVSGTFTAAQTLDRMLVGTGLSARFSEATIATLQGTTLQPGEGLLMAQTTSPAPRPPAGDVLPAEPVTVQEQRPPVTGYVATRSTVGTKLDLPLLDVPQSIQVVPRQVIDDQRAITLTDVLRNVSGFSPGVSSQSQRFGDRNVIFRGFTNNNYYTNGFKDAFNGNSISFDLANVEQVEVLKGVSSVLYGPGETGATINILTKQPLPDWYAAASVTAGSYGYVSPSIDVSGPLISSKALRFRLNAAYQQEDSFVDFVDSERYIVAPMLALSLGPATQLTLEGEYQALGELNWDGLPADGTIFGNPNGRIPRSRYLGDPELERDNFPEREIAKIGYRFEHRFNEYISLRQGFRFSYFTRDERDILGFALQEDQRTFDRDLFVAKGWSRDYYILTDLMFDVKTGPLGHKLLIGTDQRFLSTSARTATDVIEPIDVFNPIYGGLIDPIGPDTPRRISQQSGTFIGVYAQDLVTIIDQVKLLVGGRYDIATSRTQTEFSDSTSVTRGKSDDNVFTPRVGLVYQPVSPVALYASYSTSFLPLVGTTFAGNAFDPEEGVQYEGGVKLDLFEGRLSSTLAIYHLTRENVLTSDPDHPTFSIQTGEQRSRGVELDVAATVLPGLRLIGTYAYTDAKITQSNDGTQGNRPANVPTNTGSVWGVYEIGDGRLKGLGFGLGVIAVGSRPADDFDTASLPSYVRTDAALYYRRWKHLDLALNFKNLFDADYFETSTFGNADAGISPGAPFSVFGTLTARY